MKKEKCPYCGKEAIIDTIDGTEEIFCDCEIDR